MPISGPLQSRIRENFSQIESIYPSNQFHCTCYGMTGSSITMESRSIAGEKNPDGAHKYLNFSSSDYLGFGQHSDVIKASINCLKQFGTGAYGSPVLSGYFTHHKQLEAALSSYHGFEDTMLFSSGFNSNLGVIPTLLSKGDIMIVDQVAHGSIYAGAKLSTASIRTYPLGDMQQLETLLKRYARKDRTILLVTCGVFSMSGVIADLPTISNLAHRYGATLLLDDAHALGVLGHAGKGTLEHFNLPADSVDIHMGVLSKTLAGVGGYISSSRQMTTYIRSKSAPYMLSTAIPPHVAAACNAALMLLTQHGATLSVKLRKKAAYFRQLLKQYAIPVQESKAAIISIPISNPEILFTLKDQFLAKGLFLSPVVYPAVKLGAASLRLNVTLYHDQSDLENAAALIRDIIPVTETIEG